jgi:hypothetical protein
MSTIRMVSDVLRDDRESHRDTECCPKTLYAECSFIHQKYGTSEYSRLLEELPCLWKLHGGNVPMASPPVNVHLTSISIHVCFLSVRNGMPALTLSPELPTDANQEAISTAANIQVLNKIRDGYVNREPNVHLVLF